MTKQPEVRKATRTDTGIAIAVMVVVLVVVGVLVGTAGGFYKLSLFFAVPSVALCVFGLMSAVFRVKADGYDQNREPAQADDQAHPGQFLPPTSRRAAINAPNKRAIGRAPSAPSAEGWWKRWQR